MITLSQAILNRIKKKTRLIPVSDIFVRHNPGGKTIHVELRIGARKDKVEQELSLLGDISETVDDFISDVVREHYKQDNESR